MGRPPSNGVPSFRFNSVEVAEMDTILQAHNFAMPAREVLEALAEKFSLSAERSGKFIVQMKQVWHWFQNRRYALRAKAARAPETLNLSPVTQDDSSIVKNMPQAPQSKPSPQDTPIDVPEAPRSFLAPGSTGRNGADSNSMEFEAKSARDGAWYDVAMFLSHRSVEAVDPEVLVRFAGFGAEEDEWVDIGRLVRKRSLPCESSECVAVLQGDLILCFQEGKEQALYYDAHVLDAQRRRHDVRGCRCRFLVRYDHDQSEEIVPLRKVCRRPETDYRLQQLYASNDSATTNQSKAGAVPRTDNTLRVYPPAEPMQKQPKIEDFSDVPVLPGASQTKLLSGTEIQAQQTKVADTPGISSAPQSNISPQPQVMKIVSPGTMEISDASIAVQQPEVTEAQQTKVADIIDAGTPGNSSAPQSNISPQPLVIKIVSPGTMEISDASIVVPQPEVTEAQQTKVADIIDAGTPGNSSAPQSNNSPQPQVMKIVSPGTMEISDASIVVQQKEVTEIINGEDLESLNVTPSIAAIQQQKVTEIVSDANHGNSHVPPVNVVPQSEVDETSGSL